MRPKKLLLFTIALLGFIAFSCNEDDAAKNSFTVTIDASSFKNLSMHNYIILSNESGAPVAMTEITAGQIYELKPEGKYTDETFTLTELAINEVNGQKIRNLVSYMGLAAEATTWKPTNQFNTVYSFSLNYNFSGLPADRTAVASVNAGIFSINQDNSANTFSLPPLGNSTFAFVTTTTTTGTWRYKMFTNAGAGYSNPVGNYLIDLSEVVELLPSKLITHASDITNPSVSVRGIIKSGAGTGNYYLPFLATTSQGTPIVDLGSLFDDYIYLYKFSKGNNTYSNVHYTTVDKDPLQITIAATSKSSNSLTYSTTGNYDYELFFSSTEFQDGHGQWWVFTPPSLNGATVDLPQMPDELTSQWSHIDRSAYLTELFRAYDFEAMNGYKDFLNNREAHWFNPVNYKSVQILTAKL